MELFQHKKKKVEKMDLLNRYRTRLIINPDY